MVTASCARANATMCVPSNARARGRCARVGRAQRRAIVTSAARGARVEETTLAAASPASAGYVAVNGVNLAVDFEIHYETAFGERVCVLGNHEIMARRRRLARDGARVDGGTRVEDEHRVTGGWGLFLQVRRRAR